MAIEKPTLSDILSELIRNKGLTASEVARRTKIPQPTIQRITTGVHLRPHKKTLEALAAFFEITIDQLCGLEPLNLFKSNKLTQIIQIPILSLEQAIRWPIIDELRIEYTVIDNKINKRSFALKMPDASMEPLIVKDSLLIVDPDRAPQYRSLIVVKLRNYQDTLIRQLIRDANNCYIKPLSHDFDQFQMLPLDEHDTVIGTIVEVRFNCDIL